MKYNNFLYKKYKKDINSQFGEDGIIEEILKRLKIQGGNVLDIGAADGIWHSNTFELLKKGFNVYSIEANKAPKFFGDSLLKLKDKFENLHPFIIEVDDDNNSPNYINKVLKECNIPKEIELMNIDIDGPDYFLWKEIRIRPKIVIIEIEPRYYPLDNNIHNKEGNRETNPPQNLTGFFPMLNLGNSKGYTLICMTISNLIFLRNDLLYNLKLPIVTEVNQREHFNPEYLSKKDKERWENGY